MSVGNGKVEARTVYDSFGEYFESQEKKVLGGVRMRRSSTKPSTNSPRMNEKHSASARRTRWGNKTSTPSVYGRVYERR